MKKKEQEEREAAEKKEQEEREAAEKKEQEAREERERAEEICYMYTSDDSLKDPDYEMLDTGRNCL